MNLIEMQGRKEVYQIYYKFYIDLMPKTAYM